MDRADEPTQFYLNDVVSDSMLTYQTNAELQPRVFDLYTRVTINNTNLYKELDSQEHPQSSDKNDDDLSEEGYMNQQIRQFPKKIGPPLQKNKIGENQNDDQDVLDTIPYLFLENITTHVYSNQLEEDIDSNHEGEGKNHSGENKK